MCGLNDVLVSEMTFLSVDETSCKGQGGSGGLGGTSNGVEAME